MLGLLVFTPPMPSASPPSSPVGSPRAAGEGDKASGSAATSVPAVAGSNTFA